MASTIEQPSMRVVTEWTVRPLTAKEHRAGTGRPPQGPDSLVWRVLKALAGLIAGASVYGIHAGLKLMYSSVIPGFCLVIGCYVALAMAIGVIAHRWVERRSMSYRSPRRQNG
jgi:hypothetical protein